MKVMPGSNNNTEAIESTPIIRAGPVFKNMIWIGIIK